VILSLIGGYSGPRYIGPLGPPGFVGYGDADPADTSSLVRGAEMRVAETRAVNRALRKAYGIGLCSVEELDSNPSSFEPKKHADPPTGNGCANGQPRLRDKLCLLIRRYELDPNLIKRYAADFCGTETLRDASEIWLKPSCRLWRGKLRMIARRWFVS
jgi:hypothetical protein